MADTTTTSGGFRRAYAIAIALIAVCTIAAFLSLRHSIVSMSSDAALLHVSGRQAALVQRASLMMAAAHHAENALERDQALANFDVAARELVANHQALIEGDPARGLPGNPSPEIRAIYFERPHSVDKLLTLFLDKAAAIAVAARTGTLHESNLNYAIQLGRQPLTDGLRAVIDGYQAEADSRVRNLEFVNAAVAVLTLALLGLAGRLIFLPAAREIDDKTREIVRSKTELDHAATHDALTGLANRRRCTDMLDAAIDEVRARGGVANVLHLDLDGFKAVNDTMGHAAGDTVLEHVAQRLLCSARATDTVARVGGDEFVVVCPGSGVDREAAPIAERIMEAFAAPFDLGNDVKVDVGCSIGISRYPDDADNSDDLLVAADLALYRAKEGGKNRFLRFDQTMRDEFQHKIDLSRRIKLAIENDEFEVFYQPQVDMETGRVAGMEALMRWRDPERGLRPPGEVLDAIDRSGGMTRLGAFIVDRAVEDAAAWHREGLEFGRVAINIAAPQLRDIDFVDRLLNSTIAHGLPPEKVAIEIVEGALISGQSRRLMALLDEFNDLGINVEFDDFGTGYASLTHLRELPVNRIKIDQSFICDLPHSEDHASIVRGLINIVSRLGLDVVAEGVESVDQAFALKEWGCEIAQGYLFARPTPVEEATAYLRLANHKRKLATIAAAGMPESRPEDERAAS